MEKPACQSCQFFTKPGLSTTAYGDCVRYPVPITHLETHWCGEYQPSGEIRIKEPLTNGADAGRPRAKK